MAPSFEQASDDETQKREREIRILINLVQPDPQYQPFVLTDESLLTDLSSESLTSMAERFDHYFRAQYNAPFDFDARGPIWQVVDRIRDRHPDWPER